MRSNENWLTAVLAVLAVALLPAALPPHAQARRVARLPPGLSAGQWISLGDRFGLVISDYQPGDVILAGGPLSAMAAQPAPSPPRLVPRCPQRGSCQRPITPLQLIDGYFMVKVDGRWARLSIVQPPQVLHARSRGD